jgi:hypothetical protein
MVFGPDGKLYVGTRFSNSVVRTDGNTVETFIPEGISPLSRTGGCVFGPDGDFYIASQDTNDILRFNGITGAYKGEFVAADNNGGLNRPTGILFGPDGNLYVDSANSNDIVAFDGKTGEPLGNFIDDTNGGNPSGPRGLTYWNTNPTTLKYEPGRSAGPSTHGARVGSFVLDAPTANPLTDGPAAASIRDGAGIAVAQDGNATTQSVALTSASGQLHDVVFGAPDSLSALAGLANVLDPVLLI